MVPYLQNEFFRRKFLSYAECYAEWKDEHNRVEVLVGGQGQAEAGEEPEFFDHAQQEQRQHQVGQNWKLITRYLERKNLNKAEI